MVTVLRLRCRSGSDLWSWQVVGVSALARLVGKSGSESEVSGLEKSRNGSAQDKEIG